MRAPAIVRANRSVSVHDGDREAVPALFADRLNRRGGQAGIGGEAVEEFSDPEKRRVRSRIVGNATGAHHIVADDDRAGPGETQCPVEIRSIVLLVGIDEDEVERRERCQLRQGVERGPDPVEPFFQISGGPSLGVATLAENTWVSTNCGFARLSMAVGLNRVVDMTYRMAASPYLSRDLPPDQRAPIEPFASYATGANEMAPIDMAAGIQTIANEGVHKDPYYVEHIDDANGNRLYTHEDEGTRVLDRRVAREAIDILKGVLQRGTARRFPLDDARPAFGKTGTQDENTNAWFVGATKQLSTAVWVGDPDDPDASMSGNAIPGHESVAGGTIPAEIWARTMATILDGRPESWDFEPTAARQPVILVDPTVDCLDPSAAPPASGPEPRLPHLASITDGITCSPPPG